MTDIFKVKYIDRLTREKYKLILEIPKPNQVIFKTRRLRSYGSKIWNELPYHIKTSGNLNSLKAVLANIRLQDNRLSQKLIFMEIFMGVKLS